MKFPQVIFRIVFCVLAITYIGALTEFLSPDFFNINVNISYDVLGLTLLVIGYLAFFMKRSH